MEKMTDCNVGIDVSKSCLDAYRLEDEVAARFDNSPSGFRALMKWLGTRPVARIVYEPTGPYHRALEQALGGKFPLVKVNPLQARRFAQASGTRTKTDELDARALARMGAVLSLAPDDPQSANLHELKDLHVARLGIVKERTRLRNRGQTQTNPVLKRQTAERLRMVERQIKELDKEIDKLISDDQAHARKRDILSSIPGLGPVATGMILTFLPEIGALERKQAASLAGLVPHNRQSGQCRGKSFISGGRKVLRDALYMPALVAARFNPDLRKKYAQLRADGKPAKVAIVAVMRKLIETANALVKADRIWVPKEACA